MGDAQLRSQRVQQMLDVVRDALARVEEAAQESDEERWHVLARRVAVLVPPMREYVNAVTLGRDLPQQLVRRLEPLVEELARAPEDVRDAGLDDHVQALQVFVDELRATTQ